MTSIIIPGTRNPAIDDICDEVDEELQRMVSVLQRGIHRDFRDIWRIHVPFGGTVVSNRTSSAFLHHELRSKVTDLESLKDAAARRLLSLEDTPFKFQISWAYSTITGGATLGIKVSSSLTPA